MIESEVLLCPYRYLDDVVVKFKELNIQLCFQIFSWILNDINITGKQHIGLLVRFGNDFIYLLTMSARELGRGRGSVSK